MLAALGRALSSVAIVLQCSVLVAGGTGVSALGSGALAGDGLRIAQADPIPARLRRRSGMLSKTAAMRT